MQYLSGIHALNLQCSLDTSGDWHQSAFRWKDLDWRESDGSLWGDYGIDEFMGKEYFCKWLTYKESVDNGSKCREVCQERPRPVITATRLELRWPDYKKG